MNPFTENRKNVQALLYDEQFIVPLSNSLILEEKNQKKDKDDGLKKVEIFDIPTTESIISWAINLEQKKKIYTSPEWFKTTEKALILLANKRFHCFMFEMKSNKFDLNDIEQKFNDTAQRIAFLLPIYNFGNVPFDNLPPLYFKGIVFYNQDGVDTLHDELSKTRLYKILKGEELTKRISSENPILGNYKMDIDFIRNPNFPKNKNAFKVAFNQIYAKPISNTDLQCPHA
jgi:hypothetical protein